MAFGLEEIQKRLPYFRAGHIDKTDQDRRIPVSRPDDLFSARGSGYEKQRGRAPRTLGGAQASAPAPRRKARENQIKGYLLKAKSASYP
jgi:hypothetical protein